MVSNQQFKAIAGMVPNRTNCLRLLAGFLLAALLVVGWIVGADRVCQRAAKGRIFRSVEDVPKNDVALVLGTAKKTPKGSANLHFNQRIDAAVALYRSGKVRHLLVSGDNHIAGYDEPTDMSDALIAAGVPTNAITCDYA